MTIPTKQATTIVTDMMDRITTIAMMTTTPTMTTPKATITQ